VVLYSHCCYGRSPSVDPSPELFLDLLGRLLADQIKDLGGYVVFFDPQEEEFRGTQARVNVLPAQYTQWDRRGQQSLMEFTAETGIVSYLDELSHPRRFGEKQVDSRIHSLI